MANSELIGIHLKVEGEMRYSSVKQIEEIAPSTRKTYSSGERRFIDFCTLHSPDKSTPIPANEETLIKYVAYLDRTIKHSSIKGYLTAVRHLHVSSGYELDLKNYFRLQLICRGIKRSHGDSSRIRLPITITHLKLFSQLLAIPNTTNYDSIMLWAAMTLAFFSFLRLGEMTCRIKAATTSASVCLPPWLIKTLGRWSSDCYERYIQCHLSRHGLISVRG